MWLHLVTLSASSESRTFGQRVREAGPTWACPHCHRLLMTAENLRWTGKGLALIQSTHTCIYKPILGQLELDILNLNLKDTVPHMGWNELSKAIGILVIGTWTGVKQTVCINFQLPGGRQQDLSSPLHQTPSRNNWLTATKSFWLGGRGLGRSWRRHLR